jgi:hypothetical protein
MKKALFLLLLIPLLMSCEERTDTTWSVVNVTVPAIDWDEYVNPNDGSNLFYYCTIDMPEITPYVAQYGNVAVYVVDGNVQYPLPSNKHMEIISVLNPRQWTRTIEYEYMPGQINIFVTDSDFESGHAPGNMNFRIVTTW